MLQRFPPGFHATPMTEDKRMVPGPSRIAAGVERGAPFRVTVDGQPVDAYEGESIAGALLAAGHRVFRRSARRGEARGLYCAMGVCHDCRMVVDGQPNVRACLTAARPGMVVETQVGPGPVPEVSA